MKKNTGLIGFNLKTMNLAARERKELKNEKSIQIKIYSRKGDFMRLHFILCSMRSLAAKFLLFSEKEKIPPPESKPIRRSLAFYSR